MKSINVLIVEDDINIRETWKMMFSCYGFSIHTAENGLDAVNILQDHPIELIVTDLKMPIKDGYFVLEQIKSSNLKIITWVCSGQILSQKDVMRNYDIHKLLEKPFQMANSVKEIISIVHKNK